MTTTTPQGVVLNRLAKAYPNQAKNLTGGPIHIRVDDRDSDDTYVGFCDIHLTMRDRDADDFTITLDNVPFDDEVKAVAADLGGSWQETRVGQRLTLNLLISESGVITRLATAIRQVVGRGRRYEDPCWKWIARRTAKSLERLAGVVSK